jgi:hypothetical protein
MRSKKEKIGIFVIIFFGIITALCLFMVSPIAQDTSYHQFSDTILFWGIPNALNVLSNLPFLLVGCWGIIEVFKNKNLNIIHENKYAYITLFLGAALVSFGSGYYHLYPNNDTLVWDRLPMTIAFMGLVSIIISEFISVKLGKNFLLPLVIFGLFSVVYWDITEAYGKGDLRPYIFVQFFPLIAIPIVLCLFNSKFEKTSHYWWLLMAYVLAKLFEHFDQYFHEILILISGHSLKHVSAAVGLFILIKGYQINGAQERI